MIIISKNGIVVMRAKNWTHAINKWESTKNYTLEYALTQENYTAKEQK